MKEITVFTFGAIIDITGSSQMVVQGICSTTELIEHLEKQYPKLKALQYAIAVNKEIITAPVLLQDDVTVALLPPFSGG
jgi:molybdopterin synthase sulfur carrier subunit